MIQYTQVGTKLWPEFFYYYYNVKLASSLHSTQLTKLSVQIQPIQQGKK